MNVIEQARGAYAPAQSFMRTGRSAELQVFVTSTARMHAAASAGPAHFNRLAKAIHENRQLWTRLAADVADENNALPQELRAQIFYLAEFTQIHSRRVLRGQAGVEALIDINTAIIRGLSSPAAPATPTAAPATGVA